MKFTARTITALALPVGKTDYCWWDDEIAGFGYRQRVGAGGKMLRSWILQYKHAGSTRRLLIGSVAALGAEQARAEARKARAKVELGQDPQSDKVARRDKDRHTMRALVEQYLAAKKVRPRTFVEISRYLTEHFKSFGNMPVDSVTRRDVAARLVAIKNKSGAATAGAARNALSAMFAWAMGEGLAESNPVIGTNRPETNGARERVLSDDELVRVWDACDDGSEHSTVVKLLILTGCRRAEVGDLCWAWFPPDMSTFTIPAAHSKNGRPHTLPVMPMMRSIIDTVPHMANRDQLFGERSHGFTRWHCKSELDERSGVTGWTLHDLRRTVATRMADIGVQPHIIEAALNHQSGSKRGVAGTYNRSPYANEVRNALATLERYIGLIIDDNLRVAHQAYLARGDDAAREKAHNAFRDAITAGGAKWTKHVALIERGNVVAFPQTA
jgi:integrase